MPTRLGLGLGLGRGGKAPWTPASLANLELRLEAANSTLWQDSARTTPATADGQVVGSLDDLTANARHHLQATAANKPLLKVVGGKKVIRFDGVNDFLGQGAWAPAINASAWTMAVAYNGVSQPGLGVLFGVGVNITNGFALGVGAAAVTASGLNVCGLREGVLDEPTGIANAGKGVIVLTQTAGNARVYDVNGATFSASGATTPATTGTGVGSMGNTASKPLNTGDVAAVLFFSRVLSAGEIASLKAYLSALVP